MSAFAFAIDEATLEEPPIARPATDAGPLSDALSADIHLLGDLLGETIRRLAGPEAFALVEEIRTATQTLRQDQSVDEARALRDRLDGLDLAALRTLTRAF